MSHRECKNYQLSVVNLTEQAVISDAISPVSAAVRRKTLTLPARIFRINQIAKYPALIS